MQVPPDAARGPIPQHVVKHVVGPLPRVVVAHPGLFQQVRGHCGPHQRIVRGRRLGPGRKLQRNELAEPRRVVVAQGFGVPKRFEHWRRVQNALGNAAGRDKQQKEEKAKQFRQI